MELVTCKADDLTTAALWLQGVPSDRPGIWGGWPDRISDASHSGKGHALDPAIAKLAEYSSAGAPSGQRRG